MGGKDEEVCVRAMGTALMVKDDEGCKIGSGEGRCFEAMGIYRSMIVMEW